LLPDQGYGPWQTLNLYRIWWMVVLIAAMSFIGYFAVKGVGVHKGAVFIGLFAGMASSTALTLHFSRLARGRPVTGAEPLVPKRQLHETCVDLRNAPTVALPAPGEA
jgi:uncharacterized membrane protein (DUF4010 family)